jgi:hypothetical protein
MAEVRACVALSAWGRRPVHAAGVVELTDGPQFNLSDPLSGDAKSLADFLEGERHPTLKAEPECEDRPLAGVKTIESLHQVLPLIIGLEHGIGGLTLGH